MTNELQEKRWHRAFSVQQQLNLIDAARQHDPAKDFPGKIMFDTISILATVADEQEAKILDLEARIAALENRKVFDDFDDEGLSDS